MFDKIKENLHFLMVANLLFTFLLLFSGPSDSGMKLVVVNGKENDSSNEDLKKVVCQEAFFALRSGVHSDYFVHPDISDSLKNKDDNDLVFSDVEKFYFKMEGRDVCRVIARRSKGFSAYDSVISSDGPLFFRLTSINSKKPTFLEVKEYL